MSQIRPADFINPSSSSRRKSANIKRPAPPPKQPAKRTKSKMGISEILYVQVGEDKRHIGFSSLEPNKVYTLAPPWVSREDGDMEKDSPVSSPVSGREVNVFKRPKPYNFNDPPNFLFNQPSLRYNELTEKEKHPIPSVYPDMGALRFLKIYDEVVGTLKVGGLHFILKDDPGFYPEVNLEFLSYFRPIFEDGDMSKGVECWRFGLGEYYWEVGANVLRDWLRFPYDGDIPNCRNWDVEDFWRAITGLEFVGGEEHKTTSIKVKKWKIIHRLIGGNVYMRMKYGRTVTKMDLSIMLMMERKERVDWLWCITHGLLENLEPSSRNLGLGGGSIVTIIAKKLGYTFSGVEPKRKSMTLATMRAMWILSAGNVWREEKEKDKGKSKKHDETIPEFGASSSASHGYTLDSLGRKFEELDLYTHQQFAWQAEHNTWQQSTMLAFAEKWGVEVELPPRYPYNQAPNAGFDGVTMDDNEEPADSP